MGQESREIWIAETLLQPILPKSDRLLTGLPQKDQDLFDAVGLLSCEAPALQYYDGKATVEAERKTPRTRLRGSHLMGQPVVKATNGKLVSLNTKSRPGSGCVRQWGSNSIEFLLEPGKPFSQICS